MNRRRLFLIAILYSYLVDHGKRMFRSGEGMVYWKLKSCTCSLEDDTCPYALLLAGQAVVRAH